MKIFIYDNEICNIKSVENAVLYLGYTPIITKDCNFIEKPSHLIIPGVGSFDAAITKMKSNSAYENISNYIKNGNKVLGICLGMQLLFEIGNEGKRSQGLGFIDGEVVSLPKPIKDHRENIPNMGWSEINIEKKHQILNGLKKNEMVYLVHSYFCLPADNNVVTLSINFSGQKICVGFSKKNIHGFQFHPEKSGNVGLNLLKNFLSL